MDYNKNFRQSMKRILGICNITQAELAKRSNVCACFMTELLAGEANPTLKTLQDISESLQIPLPILLEPSNTKEWQAILAVLNAPKKKTAPYIPKGWEHMEDVVLQVDRINIVKKWLQSPRRGRPRKNAD